MSKTNIPTVFTFNGARRPVRPVGYRIEDHSSVNDDDANF